MNLQKTLERFAIIANLSFEEASPWIPLCEDSIEEIKHHLKDGVVIDTHRRRLEAAASALAFYKYTLYRASGGGMESFSAGELRIKIDAHTTVKIAQNVWREARNEICDLIKDDDFMFERIVPK